MEWAEVCELLQRALDEGGNMHSLQDVLDRVEAKTARLWVGRESVAVVEILDAPPRKVCHVWLAAGDIEEIVNEMEPACAEWSRGEGCSALRISGRNGWRRVLKPKGYRAREVVLERQV